MSKPMTANMNADTARELANEIRDILKYANGSVSYLEVFTMEQMLIANLLARIEALEAAAANRIGDL